MILISVSLLMLGCASPYAWKDLGDGHGMRGWAGIPLAQSAAYAASQRQPSVYVPSAPVYMPQVQVPVVQPMQIPQQAPWVPIP